MKLKDDATLTDLLHAVDQCTQDVLFKTNEGDVINLRSQLSKYIFLASATTAKPDFLALGTIECKCTEDRELLAAYLKHK